MFRVVAAVIVLGGVFGGYHVYRQLASPLLSPQTVADTVGSVYDDPHPHIVRVVSTESDGAVHEPIYILTVRGHFRYRSRTAHYLIFTASAGRWYAGSLWAGNSLNQHVHRSWFADTVPLPHIRARVSSPEPVATRQW